MKKPIFKIVSIFFVLVLFLSWKVISKPSSPSLDSEIKADKILVEKSRRTLSLLKEGKVIKTYKIALGSNPIGPKIQEGDGKTPEGIYTIDARNPKSQYHLSLHISYPNEADRKRAESLKVSPGGNIMIHGLPNLLNWTKKLYLPWDWTLGCIAVTNSEIEEIWKAVPDRTVVEILP